ncbi:speckle targeted PIP5K1A-regulated poly(A) polymerase-like [Venturia canescens]|uniref:speckle targeted PIP5K1A-regulated poly(A) polymerase-like n=1 Tax=Venturia canescens TaxID=32260 RepID=UPI001C9CBA88|nr:speckle targeted PIP5K1A-regulated poly(A) polymerase-like [Venturia canescens]
MKKLCDVCNIELDENDFPNHLKGKRHVKNVKSANYQKRFLERSIYVSRMPPNLSVDNVANFFKQFGVVERCKVKPHFAIVEFQNKDAVSCVLRQNVWMGPYKLQIGQRKWNNPGPTDSKPDGKNPEKVVSEIVFADLKTKLQEETTLEGEISTFLETVQLREDEVDKKWHAVHASLWDALKPIFPRCEINRFGSSITGLCFKGSDVDIYLNIREPINSDDCKTGWTPKTIFREVKFYLYKRKDIFERIVPIPKAKTPIIKFCHSPTSTNCDISFKNNLGVINSQLIKRLLSVDVRLKPLMMIVKFWVKTSELSGHGKFNNYAIIMMVIFYLQQPETKMLPSIADLLKNCDVAYQCDQSDFNQSIKFPCSENMLSITELLTGFFKFYLHFPFDKKVICPLDGHAHSRTEFAKIRAEEAPDTDPLQLNHPIYLQDPLELDWNITCGVTGKALVAFQTYSAVGIEVCERALKNKDKPFLLSLFTTLPAPLENQASIRIAIYAFKSLGAGLPPDFETRNDIPDKKIFAANHWYALTQSFLEDTLKKVFKLDVQTIKQSHDAKQRKMEETSDVHSNDMDEILLKCTGNRCLIAGRKIKSFCIDPSLNPIDKEALISDELLNKQIENGIKPTKIDFTCTITRGQNPMRLIARIKDRNSTKKSFKQFASFLKTKLPIIINKELSHTLQYKKTMNL